MTRFDSDPRGGNQDRLIWRWSFAM